LVTDVSWNYKINKEDSLHFSRVLEWNGRCTSVTFDRVQEFRKCIECFLCQERLPRVCAIMRARKLWRAALLCANRVPGECIRSMASRAQIAKTSSVSACAISQNAATEVCPKISITDNAIIPLKERVVDEFYDPITMLVAQDSRRVTAVLRGTVTSVVYRCFFRRDPESSGSTGTVKDST